MEMKNVIASLFIIVIAVACEKDITVDVPPQPVKLVVYGTTAVYNPFSIAVSKTAGILDPVTPPSHLVTHALVQLYEDSQLKDTLVFNSNTSTYESKQHIVAMPGKTYVLKTSAPGFTTAEATAVTPGNINIQSISRIAQVRTDADGNVYDEVRIRFMDNTAVSNYYLITFQHPIDYGNGNIHYQDIYCMHSLDKDIDRRNNADPSDFEDCIDREIAMTDKHFNGMVKELVMFIPHDDLEPVKSTFDNREYRAVVRLNNITADQFKYRKSFSAYQDSEDNPFAEPVLVFSNVTNGYGLFTTFNFVTDTIR
jgi:hypothetical protein